MSEKSGVCEWCEGTDHHTNVTNICVRSLAKRLAAMEARAEADRGVIGGVQEHALARLLALEEKAGISAEDADPGPVAAPPAAPARPVPIVLTADEREAVRRMWIYADSTTRGVLRDLLARAGVAIP